MMREQLVTASRRLAILTAGLLSLIAPPVHAVSDVFVDFGAVGTTWKANLDLLMMDIGAAPIDPGELMALEGIIMDELGRIYSDFDVTFSAAPLLSPTNIIDFTKAVGTSVLVSGPDLPKGIGDTDWLNRQFFPPGRSYQLAEVFPQEFDDIVTEFAGSMSGSRMPMILELGTALGGTAAHELGHTYGLHHWDAYGDPAIGPAGYGPFPGESIIADSMSIQNSHIMATGETGLMAEGRESLRTLSRYSKAKLEIAADPSVTPEPLVSTPFIHTLEVTSPHPIPPFAQPLESAFLPISGLHAVNVHAAGLGAGPIGGTTDFYVIRTTAAGLVSAEVISVGDYGPSVETTLKVYDAASFMPIHSADDLSFSGGMPSMIFSTTAPIDTPFFDGMEDDPLLLNMSLAAGDYLIEVSIDFGGVHAGPPGSTALFYDLFITSENRFTFIPEPTSLILVIIGSMSCFGRRAG